MSNNDISPVLIERAIEQLRQEKETFEQRKTHEDRWFRNVQWGQASELTS